MSTPPTPATPGERRPHANLLKYYVLESLLLGPFFFFLLLPRYFRFKSLRFLFDDEGVSVRWGVLFRREVSLTYGRIQDIHLESNAVERWLGLGRIKVQTAAGSAKAEMTVEGLLDFEEIRDFLGSRVRGRRSPNRRLSSSPAPSVNRMPHAADGANLHLPAGGHDVAGASAVPATPPHAAGDLATSAELAAVLRETATELRALRHELTAHRDGEEVGS